MNNSDNDNWLLSKTSFIKGHQCLKALYLHSHHHDLNDSPSSEQLKANQKGYRFEDQFRKTRFPHGINLNEKFGRNYKAYFPYTRDLIDTKSTCAIFEAGIVANQVLVLADVLFKNSDGTIEIFEIKNSSTLKNIALWDASIQYYVCKSFFGTKLTSFQVVLRGSRHAFKMIEISKQAEKRQLQIEEEIRLFTQIVNSSTEPEVALGQQCMKPYACKYISYCKLKSNSFEKEQQMH